MPETTPPAPSLTELLAAGLTALLAGSWAEALAQFAAAVALDPASPEALEGFATASWWLDDVDAAIDARERAYGIRRAGGQIAPAATLAALLAWDHGTLRGATAVANGWLERARRLTADLPAAPEHAWLALIEASFHLDTSADAVLRLSTEALQHALAHGGVEVEMTARTLQGLALVSLGRVEDGWRLLDEGTAAVTGGELQDPIAVGSCCCNMIIACERVRDFDRAAQWCERLSTYSARTGQRPLLALCRAHHGTVLTMWGDWALAEEELQWASDELTTLRPPLAGFARARLGDLRRRQGRSRDAQALLAAADGHVLVALVRAALAVDDDDPVSAIGHLEAYLRSFGPEHPVETAAAFELLVMTQIRLDEISAAHDSHERLATIATAVGTDAVRAAERGAAGALALAERAPDRARAGLQEAIALYERCRTPFEAALSRAQLARALAARGPGRRRARAGARGVVDPRGPRGEAGRARRRPARRPARWPANGSSTVGAHPPGGRGARPGRPGPAQPGDRRPTVRQRAHGPPPPVERLHQARGGLPRRGRRRGPRPGSPQLTAGHGPSARNMARSGDARDRTRGEDSDMTERHETEHKTFAVPEEVREFPNGRAEILTVGGAEVGRLIFQPGWRWSTDVKPIAGTESCEAPHFQYHVSGRLGIRMDDGTEFEVGPGDVTSLPSGHDGWVIGDEPAVVVDWYGASTYAKGG